MPEARTTSVVRELLRDATAILSAAGADTPSLDAELLLGHALGVRRDRLLIDPPAELSPQELVRFGGLVARRRSREPVAYILGEKHFRWITLRVDERVLIPRPETELLVEVGLALRSGSRVVDVGTGSGAVALALKFERPDLEMCGTDRSAEALAVARENAERLGLDVRFATGDLLDPVRGPVDAVLANLPYVAEGTLLEPEIARYEPADALFAGADGLEVIRRLVVEAREREIPYVALEISPEQADRVEELARSAGFHRVEVLRDLGGAKRVVICRR